METIAWDSSLETGNIVVDTQHQSIFRAYNRLLHAMNKGKGQQEIHMTLVFLVDYTKRHFRMEESLMHQGAYPDLAHHHGLHQEFIDKLNGLMDRSERGAVVTISVMQFMKTWLLEHIQIEDKKLAQFLATPRRNAAG